MTANFENIRLEIYGESHADRIGVRLEGIAPGMELDLHCVLDLLDRRRAGRTEWSTPRKEEDAPVFCGLRKDGDKYVVESGIVEAYIVNGYAKSGDYDEIKHVPRPSHADLAVWAKEGKIPAGGGRFSGRMTAPLCIAGGIAKEILQKRGIEVDAYLCDVAGLRLKRAADDENIAKYGLSERDRAAIRNGALPTLNGADCEKAVERLRKIAEEKDSAGGIVECVIAGIRAGEVGDALFDGIEGKLAYAAFAVPAVKGVEFGAGFEIAALKGSEANDRIAIENGAPTPISNNCGGINGGISNGLPIIMRAAVKPTPSISKPQRSVDLEDMTERELIVKGRHDACIAPRAVPAIEAACSLALLDMLCAKDDRAQ